MKSIDQRLARLESVVADTVKGLPLCVYFVDVNGETNKAQALAEYREQNHADPETMLCIHFKDFSKGATV